ncbi:MAG: hypothetical protein ABFC90_07400 [Bacteroidales bacterium]|nr:hypothetical protein [Bacteroidales bacterium]
MKKLLFLFLLIVPIYLYAQNDTIPGIEFSKFKLSWFNVMGMRGGSGSQTLNLNFKNLSDKALKYVYVEYWGVDPVGEIQTDDFRRRDFSVKCTGPFIPNKVYKQEVQIALFYAIKLTAYPHSITLTYMDNSEKEIEIIKDNLNSIFPSVPYIEIGNK